MKKQKRVFQQDKPGTDLARILISQIEDQDPRCSFLLVSAIEKLVKENPKMPLVCFRNILHQEIPKSVKEYCEYCKTT